MKYLVKGNKVLAAILSLVVIMGAAIPVNAAGADVRIEIKATDLNMSVTVPSTVPIVFNEDGTNTYPTNFKIENNSSIAGIHLDHAELISTGDWRVLAETQDTTLLPANSLDIKFYLGKAGACKLLAPESGNVGVSGYATFDADDFVIAASTSETVSFEVERAAFTEAREAASAFNLGLEFAFN